MIGEAEDGAEAVKMYNELLPDVATIDISMPKMDGIAALKAIKAAHPNAKIVTVGAMNQQNLVIEAVRAGTSDFFLKPFQSRARGRSFAARSETLKYGSKRRKYDKIRLVA